MRREDKYTPTETPGTVECKRLLEEQRKRKEMRRAERDKMRRKRLDGGSDKSR